jgi:NAD+ kinase
MINIGILTFMHKQPDVFNLLSHLVAWGKTHPEFTQIYTHHSVAALYSSPHHIDSLQFCNDEQFCKSDLIIAIGGDGTILSAARMVSNAQIPILGVNTGTIGFLSDFKAEEVTQAIEKFIVGEYQIQERTMLQCLVSGQTTPSVAALNEIHIRAEHPEGLVKLQVSLDGIFLTEYWADSVMFSTPTGSTAYNLAAGGPIIYPDTPAIIINPVNPTSLSVRPMVIPERTQIEIIDNSEQPVRILLDGKPAFTLPPQQHLNIFLSENKARFIASLRYGFFDALRDKLRWNGKPV